MKYRVELVGPRGRRVFVSLVSPEEPKALALVLHGAGSHAAPYLPFACELALRGIAAVALDLPGHGLSDGVPAHARSYRSYLEAVHVARLWAARACPVPHAFLVGESYGGTLALLYALGGGSTLGEGTLGGGAQAGEGTPGGTAGTAGGPPLRGLVLSAPAFRPTVAPPWAFRAVEALARVAPRMRLPRGPVLEATRNPVAGELVRRDPLLNRRFTAAYVAELVRAGRDAARRAPLLDLPVLFLVPGEDRVVDTAATSKVFAALAVPDRQWREFPGMAHALLLEDPAGTAQAAAEWMRGRLGTAPEAAEATGAAGPAAAAAAAPPPAASA